MLLGGLYKKTTMCCKRDPLPNGGAVPLPSMKLLSCRINCICGFSSPPCVSWGPPLSTISTSEHNSQGVVRPMKQHVLLPWFWALELLLPPALLGPEWLGGWWWHGGRVSPLQAGFPSSLVKGFLLSLAVGDPRERVEGRREEKARVFLSLSGANLQQPYLL